MGHFQTAPFIVWSAVTILTSSFAAGSLSIPELVFVLVGIQAAWEMMSEGLTIIGNISYYHKCYGSIPRLPRMIFWTATGMLITGVSFVVF